MTYNSLDPLFGKLHPPPPLIRGPLEKMEQHFQASFERLQWSLEPLAVALFVMDMLLDELMEALQRVTNNPELGAILNVELMINHSRAHPPRLGGLGSIAASFRGRSARAFQCAAYLVSLAAAVERRDIQRRFDVVKRLFCSEATEAGAFALIPISGSVGVEEIRKVRHDLVVVEYPLQGGGGDLYWCHRACRDQEALLGWSSAIAVVVVRVASISELT